MDYNQLVESKERLMSDFSKLFNLDFNFGVNIRLVDVIVHQPLNSYIDCLIKAESYVYDVEFIIDIIKAQGEDQPPIIEKQSVHINIPKMSNKGFLIANSDGVLRWRSCINIGEVRKRIRVYDNRIESNFFVVDMHFLRHKGRLIYPTIIINSIAYNLVSILLANGYTEDNIKEIFFDTDKQLIEEAVSMYSFDSVKNFVFPTVNELFIDKYFQLTKEECDEKLTAHNIVRLIEKAKFDDKEFNQFSPFDINYISNYEALINELRVCTYDLILKLTNYFSQHGSFYGEYINKSISKIFSLGKNKYAIIQTASDSNPAGFLGQSKKIYFYNSKGEKIAMSYNENFAGLICPLKTPESVNLVNIKNELARDVEISEGVPYITLLDKQFNKVKLPYRKYYRSKILTYDYFDYDENKVVPRDGKIEYLYAGKYYTEEFKSVEQFDYIRSSKQSILSYNASLIPMANKNDSVRLAMGTNMIDQAIPTIGSSPSICATGTEKEIFEQSDWSYKSPYSGKVLDIVDNFIKIQDDKNEVHVVATPPGMDSSHGTFNRYVTNVKVGDIVKAGDVIVSSNSFKQNQLCLTNQLFIAFVNYGFFDEEDGVILSKSASEALGHDMTKELLIQVPTKLRCILDKEKFLESLSNKATNKLGRLNKFGLPNVGDKFKKGDIVAVFLQEIDPERYHNAKVKYITLDKKDMMTMYYQLPYGMKEGVVESIDVLIPKGITEDGLPEVRKFYNDRFDKYQEDVTKRLQEIVHVKRDQVDPSFRVTIKIKFRYINNASIGNKVSNVYASKGSVVRVMDDDMMPRIGGPDGHMIQMIINPKSTFNRKNIAQLITAKLGYFSVIAHERHVDYIENKEFNKVREDLNKLYVTDRFTNFTDDELIKFHDQFGWYYQLNVGPNDTKYDSKVVTELSKYFGVPLDKGEKLYLPEFATYTEFPVEVGVASIMRLHFFPETKLAATGAFYAGDKLRFGIGKYRPEGQSIGEMETWALYAHGAMDLIDELAEINLSNIARSRVETEFLMLGLMVDVNRMLQ